MHISAANATTSPTGQSLRDEALFPGRPLDGEQVPLHLRLRQPGLGEERALAEPLARWSALPDDTAVFREQLVDVRAGVEWLRFVFDSVIISSLSFHNPARVYHFSLTTKNLR